MQFEGRQNAADARRSRILVEDQDLLQGDYAGASMNSLKRAGGVDRGRAISGREYAVSSRVDSFEL